MTTLVNETPIFDALIDDLHAAGVDLEPVLSPRAKFSIEQEDLAICQRIKAGTALKPAKKADAKKAGPKK